MRPVWPEHAWLPLAVPVAARRFAVDDARLAETLTACGAALVETDADVEISTRESLRGDAACALTALGGKPADGGPLPLRRAVRLVRSASLQARAARARRTLLKAGYETVAAMRWESDSAYVPWLVDVRARTLADLVPVNLLLIAGRNGRPSPTAFEACLDAAAFALGTPKVLLRESLVVAPDAAGVLRVGFGPGGEAIAAQAAALASPLLERQTADVQDRIPRVVAHGTVGLATWSLEQRLAGSLGSARLSDARRLECLDFLTLLHGREPTGRERPPIQKWLEIVAGIRPGARAPLERIAAWMSVRLRGFRTVFGHGDFFAGNLLFDADRLVGVLDWDRAGPHHYALADLLHLQVAEHRTGLRPFYGEALVREVLPRARSGGDELVRAYCARLDLTPDPGCLVALVGVCWLSWVAHELRLADRAADPLWVEKNVTQVVDAFTGVTGAGG